ncbi:S23-interacting protein [Aspergillus wentii]|nr:S23-interacting protein [Aspergillus wentii]
MAGPIHTYGPTCLLSDDDPDLAAWYSLTTSPTVRPQFFYTSSLPIDDPLSSLPPPSGGHGPDSDRAPPQPFSARDNIALEESWQSLQRDRKAKLAEKKKSGEGHLNKHSGISVPGREAVVERERKRQGGSREDTSAFGSQRSLSSTPASYLDDRELQNPKVRQNGETGSAESRARGSWEQSRIRSTRDGEIEEGNRSGSPGFRKREGRNPKQGDLDEAEHWSPRGNRSRDVSISGSPFIRAPLGPTSSPLGRSLELNAPKDGRQENIEANSLGSNHVASKPSGLRSSVHPKESRQGSLAETEESEPDQNAQEKVPVGVSRLHLVELPNLKMKPIYWSPLHDISNVLRSTWFYQNTMLPVETELANKLEDGYVYLRTWTDTWQDELNSCVENGAEAELKIVHKLWQKEDLKPTGKPATPQDPKTTSSGPEGPEETVEVEPDLLNLDENRASGQKLSERMESFHFTHAINVLRRNINMESYSEPVWPHVDQDHGGIMALPVNWRSTLSLEEAHLEAQAAGDPTTNHYSLDDITPETIPAVRSIISDVMLDIPYYLSHHKPKMIQAVVKEANRIFRLWCKNNPGFQQHGRVHLIAHSLGSAMAVDILSHQPTKIPDFDFSTTSIHKDIFEFDTKNLFICGSPVGFFLLLNKANLLPRRGRDKPGCEGDDRLRGVAGEVDKYGCLAVDNLYNIMHTTDPIAFRVNAAVDCDLAESLKAASIPSSASFWKSFGSVFRWGSAPTFTSATSSAPVRPAAVSKLPSNVELETHDFTREEIAEKRMLLLNDNGQIDYFLSGGGGPLNIQYLNMLSAHSSYWTLPDFVRFIVIEIARKQGREGTLLALRAEKKKNWKVTKG